MSEPIGADKVTVLVMAIARGSTITAAAERAQVSERTARRYAARPKFQERVGRIRAQAVAQGVNLLAQLTSRAALTLGKLLDNQDPEIQLKAARGILSDFTAVHEHSILVARVAALEGALEPAGQS